MTEWADLSSPLPPRQAQALAFIDATLVVERRFPRMREIADHMGWKNDASAIDCLDRLAWRGRLKRIARGVYERTVV